MSSTPEYVPKPPQAFFRCLAVRRLRLRIGQACSLRLPAAATGLWTMKQKRGCLF